MEFSSQQSSQGPPGHLFPNLGSNPTPQQVTPEVPHLTQLGAFAHTAPSAWTFSRSRLSLESCGKPFLRPWAARHTSLGLQLQPVPASQELPAWLLEAQGVEFCIPSVRPAATYTQHAPGLGRCLQEASLSKEDSACVARDRTTRSPERSGQERWLASGSLVVRSDEFLPSPGSLMGRAQSWDMRQGGIPWIPENTE